LSEARIAATPRSHHWEVADARRLLQRKSPLRPGVHRRTLGGTPWFRLRRVSRTFRTGRTVTVRLAVPRTAPARVQRALAQNRVVTVNLTIKAVDAAGNARTLTRSFPRSG